MWKLNLNPETTNPNPEVPTAPPKTLNVIFDLPSARKTFLWYHASAGFPTKATFLDAVRNRNYATWPKLTVTLINRYFPDSDETIKGHLKGQCQGIRSTKQIALDKIIENDEVRMKIEGEDSAFHQKPITKTHEAFFCINNLTDSIHTNQTGAFPFTSQQGNRYIMVAIHLDANYIFVKPMRSRLKEEMIRAYEKIINRMRLAGLGINKHTLDNEASDVFKQCIQQQQIQFKLAPPGNHRRNQAEHAIQTFKAESRKALQKVERRCGKQKAVDESWKAIKETRKAIEENWVFYYIPNLSCYIYGTRQRRRHHQRLLNRLDVLKLL
jgi:hypothetical protein